MTSRSLCLAVISFALRGGHYTRKTMQRRTSKLGLFRNGVCFRKESFLVAVK
jgi:hypothetical protein